MAALSAASMEYNLKKDACNLTYKPSRISLTKHGHSTEIASPSIPASATKTASSDIITGAPEAPYFNRRIPVCYLNKEIPLLESRIGVDFSKSAHHYLICTNTFDLFKFLCTLRWVIYYSMIGQSICTMNLYTWFFFYPCVYPLNWNSKYWVNFPMCFLCKETLVNGTPHSFYQ